jgi:hypothetical protein
MLPLATIERESPGAESPGLGKVEHSMKIRIRIEFDATTLDALLAALAMWFKRQ